MNIAVVGTGYVGLVAGTCFAETGHFVTCVDKDESRIDTLRQGKMPIYEPGLEELVRRNVEEGRLTFSTELEAAVKDCLFIFLCVGTPESADGSADISAVLAVAEQVGRCMDGYRIVVNKSTCPVGTTDKVKATIEKITDQDFDVVSNPEFLREGSAVEDFMRPDRVVVGCDDVRVTELMRELYAPVLRTGNPFIAMDRLSAELAKYASNTMLAARISLINELACLCEHYGGDIGFVRQAVGSDRRIGAQYLYPSLGYGGSCFPKDVAACAKLAIDAGLGDGVLAGTMAVNERQQNHFVQRILDYYGDTLGEKRFACWGAAFKARTDDLRCAPALRVIDGLIQAGAEVRVYDPVASKKLSDLYGERITVMPRQYDVLEDADGLIIPTEWREFQSPDFERMGELMREKVIFDGRNLYMLSVMKKHGFRYFSIGRPDVVPED